MFYSNLINKKIKIKKKDDKKMETKKIQRNRILNGNSSVLSGIAVTAKAIDMWLKRGEYKNAFKELSNIINAKDILEKNNEELIKLN